MTGGATPPSEGADVPDDLQVAARSARAQVRALIARTLMVLADHPTVVVAGQAAAEVQDTRDDLRRAIAGHARLTRRMGDPAEQVVLAVKTAAEEALDELWAATGRRARMHLPALRADVVRWTIDAYYDTGDGDAPAR